MGKLKVFNSRTLKITQKLSKNPCRRPAERNVIIALSRKSMRFVKKTTENLDLIFYRKIMLFTQKIRLFKLFFLAFYPKSYASCPEK